MATHAPYLKHRPTPQQELAAATQDEGSAEALLEGLKLLRSLHDHGVLDVLTKAVRGGSGLSGEALHILERQSSTQLIRNLLEVVRTLTELDPNATSTLGRALNKGVEEGARRVSRGEGVGVGEVLGLMRDKDVQIALGALFGTLKGFGRALRDSQAASEASAQASANTQAGRSGTSARPKKPTSSKAEQSTSRLEAGG